MREPGSRYAFTHDEASTSNQDYIEAFRQRQEQDLKRFARGSAPVLRRKPFRERCSDTKPEIPIENENIICEDQTAGEEAWQNSEGDGLKDFGVDEEAEFYDEDDLPLAEVLRRRRP